MAWPEPALFFVASTKTLSAFLSASQCIFLLSWVCAHLCLCLVAFLCILHLHICAFLANTPFCFCGCVLATLFAQLCLRAIFVWEGGLQVVVTYGVPLTYPTHGTICRSGGRLNLLHDRRSLLVNVPRLLKQFLLG